MPPVKAFYDMIYLYLYIDKYHACLRQDFWASYFYRRDCPDAEL